ncbi:hypothetical protein CDAR_501611 [Caerostris darwini]|uniref:Uncharacterized protein n=1 Tax=Caerostris darwini TaxID=1538125 RepID=A0AAV4PSP0_9ARAC|nr:hypothetical protein CDAR_501611 [Caerostris darwini]
MANVLHPCGEESTQGCHVTCRSWNWIAGRTAIDRWVLVPLGVVVTRIPPFFFSFPSRRKHPRVLFFIIFIVVLSGQGFQGAAGAISVTESVSSNVL